jgi:hypothetical protein
MLFTAATPWLWQVQTRPTVPLNISGMTLPTIQMNIET